MPATRILDFIRKGLKYLLKRPVTRIANRISSAPDKAAVMEALTDLYRQATQTQNKRTQHLSFSEKDIKVIIFSDQHRGARPLPHHDPRVRFKACADVAGIELALQSPSLPGPIDGSCDQHQRDEQVINPARHSRPDVQLCG